MIKYKSVSRKERREQKEHQPILMRLVNSYLKSKEETETPEILEHSFNELQNEWKVFVNTWNQNHKRATVLRTEECKELVEDTIKKQEDETERD